MRRHVFLSVAIDALWLAGLDAWLDLDVSLELARDASSDHCSLTFIQMARRETVVQRKSAASGCTPPPMHT